MVHARRTGDLGIESWGDGGQARSFMYIADCLKGTQDIMDSDILERRTGSSEELFAGRLLAPPWIEAHMLRTDDLTSRTDDPFRAAHSGNLGIRKRFCESAGRFDESFERYGLEDIELGCRAYATRFGTSEASRRHGRS